MSAARQSTDGQARGKAARLMLWADRLQQRNRVLAVAVGTWKKFSDDQAGNLAALIAYYAFASLFPLLLVFVSVLDLVLSNNAKLRDQLLTSALSKYPVIGQQIEHRVSGLSLGTTGFALFVGLALTLYGARGVAVAMQNAVNSVWEVPQYRRPRFPWSLLRSFGLIAVLGPGMIVTITISSTVGGTGHVHLLSGTPAKVAAVAVSLVLNAGLFWLGFRIAAASEVATRDLRLTAILSAFAWQLLQLAGGYFVGHQLKTASAYGAFAIVLGLLAWFYLQAQITLYLVELTVVRAKRLWPRSLAPPPLTAADLEAYELYAQATQRRPELSVDVAEEPKPPGDS